MWIPVRLKRKWIPEWFFRLFCDGSKIWLLDGAANRWPWRDILMRKPTEFEQRRFTVREGEGQNNV